MKLSASIRPACGSSLCQKPDSQRIIGMGPRRLNGPSELLKASPTDTALTACCPAERKQGGVGELLYPLVSDLKKEISEAFGVLSGEGVALRGTFILDKEGVVQHATVNNLAFGRSVDETLRTLQVGEG